MKRYAELNRGEITPCDTGDWYRVEDVDAEIERRTFAAEQKAEQWQTACEASTIERDALRAVLATALMPVPVGEKCALGDVEKRRVCDSTNLCIAPGADWRIYAMERRCDDTGNRYLMPVTDDYPPVPLSPNTIVQPVRLVPAMEVINDADHY